MMVEKERRNAAERREVGAVVEQKGWVRFCRSSTGRCTANMGGRLIAAGWAWPVLVSALIKRGLISKVLLSPTPDPAWRPRPPHRLEGLSHRAECLSSLAGARGTHHCTHPASLALSRDS